MFHGVEGEIEEVSEFLWVVGIGDGDLECGPHELFVEDSGDLSGSELLEFPAVHSFADESEE